MKLKEIYFNEMNDERFCDMIKAYCRSGCQSEFNFVKKPLIKTCLDADNFQWIVYSSSKWCMDLLDAENGKIKLVSVDVAKIDHGTIIISDTLNPSSIIKYVKAYKSIVSSFDSGKSLGNMNSNLNESRLTMNACDNSEPDQKWVARMAF
ncbi:hypothetical protein U3516DRAFT_784400 [Neocallimastix sp. 'constans']